MSETFEKLLKNAKKDSQGEDQNEVFIDDKYNINYLLSHNQIHLGALFQINNKLKIQEEKGFEEFYIDGLHIPRESTLSSDDFEPFFGESVGKALASASKGKPAFFSVDDEHHHVLVSLLPDPQITGKFVVGYVNSIPLSDGKSANENTGRNFASGLVEYLIKAQKIDVSQVSFRDFSCDQQVGNACGLAVVSNIASIVEHYNKKKPIEDISSSLFSVDNIGINKKSEAKEIYFANLGQETFEMISLLEPSKIPSEPEVSVPAQEPVLVPAPASEIQSEPKSISPPAQESVLVSASVSEIQSEPGVSAPAQGPVLVPAPVSELPSERKIAQADPITPIPADPVQSKPSILDKIKNWVTSSFNSLIKTFKNIFGNKDSEVFNNYPVFTPLPEPQGAKSKDSVPLEAEVLNQRRKSYVETLESSRKEGSNIGIN